MAERYSHDSSNSVLMVGNGAREHAILWALSQSHHIGKLYCAPGNAGTESLAQNIDIDPEDVNSVTNFVAQENVGMTVIGPEVSLAAGLSDALMADKRSVFGPSSEAAMLETSKTFAVEFMRAHGIPHPETHIFSDPLKALDHIQNLRYQYVVKASGLAAGKGVFLPNDMVEATQHVMAISAGEVSNIKGDRILVQKRLKGREISIISFTDGKNVFPLIPAQDYERAQDGDKGPNTGGMGSIAPSYVDKETMSKIHHRILMPTINAMSRDGKPFVGIIYAGLIDQPDCPSVIEFNARFGDPETQAQMMMLNSDLYIAMQAAIEGRLQQKHVQHRNGAAACVVLAENGYPGEYKKGHEIFGLDNAHLHRDVVIFHGGTKRVGSRVVTDGGRVLTVAAHGNNLDSAVRKAYDAIGGGHNGHPGVGFSGMEYRRDIGK